MPRQFLYLLGRPSILDVALGDNVEQQMTLLFSDIRDFTTLSESILPAENFRFINSYLSTMEPVVSRHQGFIDKYIGDGIMALFPAEADDAVRCGIDMLRQLVSYNDGRSRAGYAPIRIGIGVNTGLVMMGTVGGHNRMDSTVIGDAVNKASRLEGLTKSYGTSFLISEHTPCMRCATPGIIAFALSTACTSRGAIRRNPSMRCSMPIPSLCGHR